MHAGRHKAIYSTMSLHGNTNRCCVPTVYTQVNSTALVRDL